MQKTDLSLYDNAWFNPGGNALKRWLWYIINALVFNSYFVPISGPKRMILNMFGAKIAKGVVIKPKVNIKYPWHLHIGENTWIGEEVWIDCLTTVKIGANCCLSQGAMLLTGNHDYTKTAFDLMVKPIELEDGVWIGAKAVVCPGVICKTHSVLSVSSIATKSLEPYTIYCGNPAGVVKSRNIVGS